MEKWVISESIKERLMMKKALIAFVLIVQGISLQAMEAPSRLDAPVLNDDKSSVLSLKRLAAAKLISSLNLNECNEENIDSKRIYLETIKEKGSEQLHSIINEFVTQQLFIVNPSIYKRLFASFCCLLNTNTLVIMRKGKLTIESLLRDPQDPLTLLQEIDWSYVYETKSPSTKEGKLQIEANGNNMFALSYNAHIWVYGLVNDPEFGERWEVHDIISLPDVARSIFLDASGKFIGAVLDDEVHFYCCKDNQWIWHSSVSKKKYSIKNISFMAHTQSPAYLIQRSIGGGRYETIERHIYKNGRWRCAKRFRIGYIDKNEEEIQFYSSPDQTFFIILKRYLRFKSSFLGGSYEDSYKAMFLNYYEQKPGWFSQEIYLDHFPNPRRKMIINHNNKAILCFNNHCIVYDRFARKIRTITIPGVGHYSQLIGDFLGAHYIRINNRIIPWDYSDTYALCSKVLADLMSKDVPALAAFEETEAVKGLDDFERKITLDGIIKIREKLENQPFINQKFSKVKRKLMWFKKHPYILAGSALLTGGAITLGLYYTIRSNYDACIAAIPSKLRTMFEISYDKRYYYQDKLIQSKILIENIKRQQEICKSLLDELIKKQK